MVRYKLELLVSGDGMPLVATVVTYVDDEQVGITTQACEPFVQWVETMNTLLDSLPVQQRLP